MKHKISFTLVEVLITIGVVGIVAALTIPLLVTNINDKIRSAKIESFSKKLRQGTDLLNIHNGIGPYYDSTEAFLNELSKHMKIIKICSQSNLLNCIPYDKITKRDGSIINTQNFNLSGGDFHAMKDPTHEYMDTSAVVFGDGSHMILTYNKKCQVFDPDNVNSQDTSSCIYGFYDINGAKGPNKIGVDIVSYNGNCDVEFGSYCVSMPFDTYIAYEDCVKYKSDYGLNSCYFYGKKEYWFSAVQKCGGINSLPSKSELTAIVKSMYVETSEGKSFNSNSVTAKKLGLNRPTIFFTKENSGAYAGCIKMSSSGYTYDSHCIKDLKYKSLCIGD